MQPPQTANKGYVKTALRKAWEKLKTRHSQINCANDQNTVIVFRQSPYDDLGAEALNAPLNIEKLINTPDRQRKIE